MVGPEPHPPLRQVRAVPEGQAGILSPRPRVQHVPSVHVPPQAVAVSAGTSERDGDTGGGPRSFFKYLRLF